MGNDFKALDIYSVVTTIVSLNLGLSLLCSKHLPPTHRSHTRTHTHVLTHTDSHTHTHTVIDLFTHTCTYTHITPMHTWLSCIHATHTHVHTRACAHTLQLHADVQCTPPTRALTVTLVHVYTHAYAQMHAQTYSDTHSHTCTCTHTDLQLTQVGVLKLNAKGSQSQQREL